LPSYLLSRGFTLLRTGAVAALPYAAGIAGLLLCSYISDRTRGRKPVLVTVLLGIAVCMLALPAARTTTGVVALLIAAGFFLPAIHGPFWSIVMDLLPASIMGFSTGFINTGGQIAGLVSPIVIGALIQWTGKYEAGFLFMAAAAAVSTLLTLTLPESRGLTRSASAASPASQTVPETGAGVV
jgi:sugar phosphate permease